MPKRLLNDLYTIANSELPLIDNDVLNASTLFALQAIVKRQHEIQKYLTHALVLTIHKLEGNPVPAPEAPPQRQAAQPQPQRQFGGSFIPPGARQAAAAPRTMDVTITPNGTQVNAPGLPPATFVPGEAAHMDFGGPFPTFGSPAYQPSPQGVPVDAVPLPAGTPIGGTREAPAEVFLPRGGSDGGGQVLVAQPQGARDITGQG